MTRKHLLLGPLLAASLFGRPGLVLSDEPNDEKARAAEFLSLAKAEAAAYTFRPDTPGDQAFTLRAEPVLVWTNPVVGSIHGAVFVGTVKGRPEAIASLYKWYSPFRHRTNEFQSLSLGTFVAERGGRAVWSPSRPGLELKPIPGAPGPAASAPQRLRQMREMAQDFTARQTDRSQVTRDMRLLTRPIYRYEGTEGDLVDGGLFVFVLGTDPEAFLLMEARRTASGPLWQYGVVRMNSIEMRVDHKGRESWRVETLPWAQVRDPKEPYITFPFNPGEAAP
jgi:hypothetical protein